MVASQSHLLQCQRSGEAGACASSKGHNSKELSPGISEESRMALLQSLQRLSCHLPRCVVRDFIQLVKTQEEDATSSLSLSSRPTSRMLPPSMVSAKQLFSKEASQKCLFSGLNQILAEEPEESELQGKVAYSKTTGPTGKGCQHLENSSSAISRRQLVETLAAVERMLGEDDFSSGSSGEDESCATDSTSTSDGSNELHHHSGDDDDDKSLSSYEEQLSDLEEEDNERNAHDEPVHPKCRQQPEAVNKLRQGRLVARTSSFESARSVETEKSVGESTASAPTNASDAASDPFSTSDGIQGRLLTTKKQGALLFCDVSGFSSLANALEIEPFSKVVHTYFQYIVDTIQEYGGDIQKMAGDAVLATWTDQQEEEATLAATLCAVKLVDLCSDFVVEIPANTDTGVKASTTFLNVHSAIGFGDIVATHVGDHNPGGRMEYLLLGDALRQVSEGIRVAGQGEVVASPEVVTRLEQHFISLTPVTSSEYNEDGLQLLAYKNRPFFSANSKFGSLENLHAKTRVVSLRDSRALIQDECQHWPLSMLETLQRHISPYVHSVVLAEEMTAISNAQQNPKTRHCESLTTTSSCISNHNWQQQSLAELRDVCTVFVQPDIPISQLTGAAATNEDVLDQLNRIMWIIASEVDRFDAHLRQFIVDDKGLVIIFNFGLRGSTFPNMIEERAIPCMSHVRTLLRSELDLECRIGATYGKAYCGNVTEGRNEYTVLGPAVNLAARLMAHARNPGVLVDEQVKQKSGNRPFSAICPIQAKGYKDYVNIYTPEGNTQRSGWKECSSLVGRQLEVARIISRAEAILKTKNPSSRMVFIEGPYGAGKSSLLSHTTQMIDSMGKGHVGDIVTFRHVCCDDDSFSPFSIVRPLFLEILRQEKEKITDKRFEEVELVGHTDAHAKDDIEEAQLYVLLLQICLECVIPLHYVEVFAGLIFTSRLSDIGTWSDASTKMNEWNSLAKQLVKAIMHMTRKKQLLVLALDCLSGLDEMSWKVIQGLFYRADNVLIMGAARVQHDLNICESDWDNMRMEEDRFLHLQLEALDEKGCTELVKLHLKGRGFARFEENVARTVFLECRGNPLIACEILAALYPSVSAPKAPELFNSTVKNVEELVLNRLDSLSPGVRPFLNLGAMLGSPFYASDVIAVMERYHETSAIGGKSNIPATARKSLLEAVDNGLLSITAYEYVDFGVCEASAYSFSHSMWQETISNQILDEWKDTMRELINEVLVNGTSTMKISTISPLKRTRYSSMPVIKEGAVEEPLQEEEGTPHHAAIHRKQKSVNQRLQSIAKIFRRSYKTSGRKGAKESLQKLKGMIKGARTP